MELRSATTIELAAELDSKHAAVAAGQRRLLLVVAECDREEVWRTQGCRDLAQWLSHSSGDLQLGCEAVDQRRTRPLSPPALERRP